MKVVVLGGNGFVGRNVVGVLKNAGIEVDILSRKTCNFDLQFLGTNGYHDRVLREADYVVNCAANVGSLNYVTDKAAEVIHTNSTMILNLYYILRRLQSSAVVINPIANCAFPGHLTVYKESDFWNGEVHESVLSYGSTRRLLIGVAKCYEIQHGVRSINYYVPNMYGEYDSTNPNKAHALNALIFKSIRARILGENITVWGTGNPIREWLYAKDFGEVILETIKRGTETFLEPINIGQHCGISIRELLSIIGNNFSNKIDVVYDATKQDGASEKVMDDKKFKLRFPNFKFTNFDDGIKNTIKYYKTLINGSGDVNN